MDILNKITNLSKFKPSNDKWENPLSCREGRSMELRISQRTLNAFAFILNINLYLTNLDTDFILDIDIANLFEFKTKNKIPSPLDLYKLYLSANKEGNKQIQKEAVSKGITIDVQVEPRCYNEMKEGLDIVIQKYLSSLQ